MSDFKVSEFEERVMLAILSLNNETYTVPLKELLESVLGKRVSIGALFTTISRLEEKGYVKTWYGDPTAERGGKAKKFVYVTGLGERALQESEGIRRRLTPTNWKPIYEN